jgi:hypothetical protein
MMLEIDDVVHCNEKTVDDDVVEDDGVDKFVLDDFSKQTYCEGFAVHARWNTRTFFILSVGAPLEVPDDWAGLVGKPAAAAARALQSRHPFATVETRGADEPLPTTYRGDRIRILADAEGKVAAVPSVM